MTKTGQKELVMPIAPAGMKWVLRFNPDYDDATLWLYWRKLIGGAPVRCSTLGKSPYGRLKISTADVDTIVEAAVKSAHEMLRAMSQEPKHRSAMEAKTAEVHRRLGITVEIKR